MSDYLQLSILKTGEWPVDSTEYPYEYMQLTPAPPWEENAIDSESTGLHGPAWAIFCRTSIPCLTSEQCEVLQPFRLIIFNGTNAAVCAKNLSPLPQTALEDIENLVRNNSPWTGEEIRRSLLSLKNALSRWIRRIPPGHIGVARLYDWGKY
jgi:hypothetical protein